MCSELGAGFTSCAAILPNASNATANVSLPGLTNASACVLRTECEERDVCAEVLGPDYATCANTEESPWVNAPCSAWHECVQGQEYVSQEPNSTADRQCARLTVCNSSTEFESVPPAEDADRTCTPLTTCTAAQWESLSANATRNRQCTDLTQCNETMEYESVPPDVSRDRNCTALTVCSAHATETVVPTPFTDRGCECNVGWWGDDGSWCRPWTECDDTQLLQSTPNSTHDRACEQLIQDCSGVWGGGL